MLSFLQTFLCFISIAIFAGYVGYVKKTTDFKEKPVQLIVGILSSRENFLNREAGRETWLKEHLSNSSSSVKVWFILGNSSCDIPQDYRLSPYSCEKWNITVSGLKENFFTLSEINPENCSSGKEEKIHQGFTFKVNHPLVVTKLGILSRALLPNTEGKVAIMDIQSKEIIVHTTIIGNLSSVHGYLYAPVENILFPKGYEGLVLFEGFMKQSICSSLIWDDGGGVVTFKKIYSTLHHQDSIQYSPKVFSVASIGFFIHEMENLKRLVEDEALVTYKWNLHLKEVQNKIDDENSLHRDLLITDSVDTYRNLPVKLLKFYKWLHSNQNFLYVMKTDDDSVINIDIILKELEENSKFNPEKFWVWSRFRKDWPINLMGKWADDDYKCSYYPSFPCGAAYVLSKQTVQWLSLNSDFLYPYQGEDVSHGIWLSAVNPILIEDEYFECDTSCNGKSYNRAQLKTEEIWKSWSYFKECKNLCNCSDL